MENDRSHAAAPRHSKRGVPLTALFFTLAVSAVLLALLGPVLNQVRDQQIALRDLLWASAQGAGCGSVLGLFLGLYHYRPFRGAGCGILTGIVIGASVGPTALATNFEQTVATCLGGSLLLVVIGAICRLADN